MDGTPKDQVILITGAASGIGLALAEGFLRDGARVVAADINGEALTPLKEKGALTIEVDVSESSSVASMIARAVEERGRLDVLFNNAGMAQPAMVTGHKPHQFERMLTVNLFGPYYGMRVAIPIMRAQGYGRIISTLSRAGESGQAYVAAYGSSKAALFALTRSAASETLDADILINALIPGPTKTPMNPYGHQDPAVVYPTAKFLATLPKDGPTGRVFWDLKEYQFMDPTNGTFRRDVREARRLN